MSELPGRPDLDQLRRQARELLRAAADAEPSALARIHAVSQRVSLSAAHLALAREHGFASWHTLRAEVARRLTELRAAGERAGRAEARWSFGGASPIETTAGMLSPGGLVAGPGQAILEASLMPAAQTRYQPAVRPRDESGLHAWVRANGKAADALAKAATGAVTLTDDQGTTYALHGSVISGWPGGQGQEHKPVSLCLWVDPVPGRELGWLELRGKDGSATRLLRSGHPGPGARVGRLVPAPDGAAARELSDRALDLIRLRLTGADQDAMERYCSAALARAAELQQAGEPGGAADLPGHLAELCAVLTGRGAAGRLPRAWSAMIDAADRADGALQHLDIDATLPPVDGIVVRVECLVSEPGAWNVYLRAEPGWWIYSPDGNSKRACMSVHAEDDLGGVYVSQFGGSAGSDDHEDLALSFLPRLNPAATGLTLTFTCAGQQVPFTVRLP